MTPQMAGCKRTCSPRASCRSSKRPRPVVLIALLAGRLFGTAAGVFAALLWLLNPFVIGLGHLDGIDIPATFTTLLTALAVLHARRKPSARGAVLVGVCAGLAILAHVTGLLVVVMAAAALLECDWRVRPPSRLRFAR